MNSSLTQRELLDPREAVEAAALPIADAVNIPFSELPTRTHELPPKHRVIRVAAEEPLASRTVRWLERGGRRATTVSGFRFDPGGPGPGEIGRLWEPNAFLAAVLPELPAGRALDLACGTGRDAVFMSSYGWNVTGIDILPDALARARALAARCAPALSPISWVEADLDLLPASPDPGQPSPPQQPELSCPFDVITAFRYFRRPLLAWICERIRPGGSLLCEAFTALHRQRHNKPTCDAAVLRPGELPALLEHRALESAPPIRLEIRHYSEDWREDGGHTARLWAVRR